MATALALTPGSPTKTYVVEAHTEDPAAALSELPCVVEPTDDAYLLRLHTRDGTYWLDQLDERFWRFHTEVPNASAYPMLRDWIGRRRDLDWMWLPSEHLRHMWPGAISRRVRTDFRGTGLVGSDAPAKDMRVQLFGADAEHLLDVISDLPGYSSAVSFEGVENEIQDDSFGWVKEAVNRMGRFAASGDSLDLHLQFVDTVVERYKRLVTLCEDKAIKWNGWTESDEGGGSFSGSPIVIRFSRAIDDVSVFADALTSSREPFRLWGTVDATEDFAEIDAVDLHVGQTMQIDVGREWMRIYLRQGACGNTVARLITNLQHRFDGALSFEDADLQDAAGSRGRSVRPAQRKVGLTDPF